MRFAKTLARPALGAIAVICSIATAQAAPLPTNIEAMKAVSADDTVQQVRWGGNSRGGVGYPVYGYGYRPGAGVAAGAIVGGAIAGSAYYGYGGYPYYDYYVVEPGGYCP